MADVDAGALVLEVLRVILVSGQLVSIHLVSRVLLCKPIQEHEESILTYDLSDSSQSFLLGFGHTVDSHLATSTPTVISLVREYWLMSQGILSAVRCEGEGKFALGQLDNPVEGV